MGPEPPKKKAAPGGTAKFREETSCKHNGKPSCRVSYIGEAMSECKPGSVRNCCSAEQAFVT